MRASIVRLFRPRATRANGATLGFVAGPRSVPVADPATEAFVESLRLLNDALAGSSLAGRYWVWGGLLIGWARDGAPLAHDVLDADFCVLAEHVPLLAAAAPALVAAGFEPALRFRANDGSETEYSFVRAGAKFEFFVLRRSGGLLWYHDFSLGIHEGGPPTQAVAAIADQPLEPFELVGRTWLKHADHEAELTAMYDDWRTPDPHWWYMDDRAIVGRTTWIHADDLGWAGSFAGLEPPPGS
jgi:hypothetical protein